MVDRNPDEAHGPGVADHAPQPLPAAPPPEVLDAVAAAAAVIAQLEAQGLRLVVEVDEGRRLRVLVIDGDGRVTEELPPQTVASVLAGDQGLEALA